MIDMDGWPDHLVSFTYNRGTMQMTPTKRDRPYTPIRKSDEPLTRAIRGLEGAICAARPRLQLPSNNIFRFCAQNGMPHLRADVEENISLRTASEIEAERLAKKKAKAV